MRRHLTEIAKAVGCKRGNVYKALKAAGLNYVDLLLSPSRSLLPPHYALVRNKRRGAPATLERKTN